MFVDRNLNNPDTVVVDVYRDGIKAVCLATFSNDKYVEQREGEREREIYDGR